MLQYIKYLGMIQYEVLSDFAFYYLVSSSVFSL
uniref:Uncharacterized protein n=1 Tax=virus sp. ctEfN2 TaxID=2825810 RepID=A0A8S5RMR8_9VIRU|nr:MAG TPA: hypothetical protein [virus sp. ctEfN2]